MSQPDLEPSGAVLSASQALEFLADAGDALSSSLDYAETLRRVARLAVPELADWCAVYVEGDDEDTEITSVHPDADFEATLQDIRQRRRRREGASESRRVAQSGESILASDVRRAIADDVGEEQRRLIERLMPRSYMLVPLIARGRSIGSLTLLSMREGRHYTAEDLAFAQTLAARCAVAIDNARLHDAAERSLSLLDTVFATAPVGLAFVDRDLRIVRVNETLAGFDGRPIEEYVGRTIEEALGDAARELEPLYRHVLDTGQPLHDLQLRPAGSGNRHFSFFCTPVRGPSGDLLGASAVVLDVTERHRLLEAEREARARADFLARAGALLDESLDYEQTLRAVARIAVPDIADWCAVSILDDRGELHQVAAEHVDPTQRRLGEELNRRYPPNRQSGTAIVAGTGRTQYVREITEAMLLAGIGDPEQLAFVRRLELRSIIIAALRAHGRTFGALTLANTTDSRLFEPADVQLAEELARRAGTAIDNARLYTERTHIAHTLQTKLLPERLPEIPGVMVAARYRAAGELNEVGGDFYDVFLRSPDEWAIVVGDVSGKGPEAAAVTALARYTLRAGASEDHEPEKALRRLNAAMLAHDDTDQFATAALAYLSALDRGRIELRLALAGHPPAMLIRADGSVEAVGGPGTLLGAFAAVTLTQTEHVLGAGDAILLYTDGVTEAGPRRAPFGDTGFEPLLATLAGQTPQQIVEAVEEAVVAAYQGRSRDDIALLALAVQDR